MVDSDGTVPINRGGRLAANTGAPWPMQTKFVWSIPPQPIHIDASDIRAAHREGSKPIFVHMCMVLQSEMIEEVNVWRLKDFTQIGWQIDADNATFPPDLQELHRGVYNRSIEE